MSPTIIVTSDDIHKGIPGDAGACPIARAIRRSIQPSPEEYLAVDGLAICIGSQNYKVPEAAIAFIESFDAGNPVEPFSFDLGERIDDLDGTDDPTEDQWDDDD